MKRIPIAVTPRAANKTNGKASAQASRGRKRYCGKRVLHLIYDLRAARQDMDRECYSMNDVVHLVLEDIEHLMRDRRCSYADIARIFSLNGCEITERTLKDYLARARKDAREGRSDYSEMRQLILESGEEGDAGQPGQEARTGDDKPEQPARDGIASSKRNRAHARCMEGSPEQQKKNCIVPAASCPGSSEQNTAPEMPASDDFMTSLDNGYLEHAIARDMDAIEARDRKMQEGKGNSKDSKKHAQDHIQAVYGARKRRMKSRLAREKRLASLPVQEAAEPTAAIQG